MRGHIRQRGAGSWAIVLDCDPGPDGKRKQKWISFAGTKRQAQIRCAELIAELQSGGGIDPSNISVGEFLVRWLDHMQGQVSPKSLERYTEIASKNLIPLLGKLKLTKLKPADISAGYARALTSGRRDGSGGLSPRTVTHLHRILKQALGQAVRWQLLPRNPCDAVKPPRVERQQMSVLDAAATAELLEAARPHPVFIAILLGVLCGMRRGEICALQWRSVDLDTGQLGVSASVEQTSGGCRTKETKSGRARTLALPQMVVTELRRHRIEQASGYSVSGYGLPQTSMSWPKPMARRCSRTPSPTPSPISLRPTD